jgi:hypothetical protein
MIVDDVIKNAMKSGKIHSSVPFLLALSVGILDCSTLGGLLPDPPFASPSPEAALN